jgi:hypothetical protein
MQQEKGRPGATRTGPQVARAALPRMMALRRCLVSSETLRGALDEVQGFREMLGARSRVEPVDYFAVALMDANDESSGEGFDDLVTRLMFPHGLDEHPAVANFTRSSQTTIAARALPQAP